MDEDELSPSGDEQKPRWHSATWWVSVSGIVGVLALVVAFLAYVLPVSQDRSNNSGSTGPSQPLDGRVRSPHLGLEIYQDDHRVLFQTESTYVRANLESRTFEIRLPVSQEGFAISICAWPNDSVISLLDEDYFRHCGTGIADYNASAEILYLNDPANELGGHNFLVGERIAPGPPGFGIVYFADIERITYGGDAQEIPRPWGSIFLRVDSSWSEEYGPEPEEIDFDTEYLRLDFG